MVYSQLYFKNKLVIPIPLAFLFVFLLIIFFTRIFHKTSLSSKASKKAVRRMEITNLTPNQVAAVWQTDTKSTGWLLYGDSPKNLNSLVADERDLADKKTLYFNHYTVLRNLKEGKKYFFVIVVDNQLVKNPSGQPFSFSTPASQSISKTPQPTYGKVLKPNNLPLENGVVFLSFPNSYLLSTLTKSTGEWLIPLNVVYDKETLTAKIPSPSEKVKIEIISEDNLATTIETKASRLSPLPETIVIGKNYNFLSEDNVLSAETGANLLRKDVAIIYPQEGALIPGFTPIIKGLGSPNSQALVNLFTGSKTYTAKVTTDKDGIWSLLFSDRLPLGKHKIILTAKNRKGEETIVERNFLIVANEGNDARVLGEATPEPTLRHDQTPTPIISQITIAPTTPVSGGGNFFQIVAGSASFIILGLGLILIF